MGKTWPADVKAYEKASESAYRKSGFSSVEHRVVKRDVIQNGTGNCDLGPEHPRFHS